MKDSYDFIVIGGGSAGYAAARTAHDLGMSTAVIDGAEELGGLCILRGCMPSKTLIESANRYRSMRRAEEFGLRSGTTEVKAEEIIERKRRLIADFAGYRQDQLADGRFDLIRGTASFSGENQLLIALNGEEGPQSVSFKSALIATGSRVSRVEIEGLEETGYWTSDDILDASELPDSVIVLGGGAIALEMACYLEGLGKEVTVIQRSDQVLSGSDRDITDALEKALTERDNFTLYTGTSITQVFQDPVTGKKSVVFDHKGEEKTVGADQILQALGRTPNSDGLALEKGSVTLRNQGKQIETNDEQVTSNPAVFAAGDVSGPHEIVHIAIEQGEMAAHNAAVNLGFTDEPKRYINYRLKLLGIFTDPEVAMVGLSENEAREQGIPFAAASYPFDDHGKSMVKGETHGFVKMIVHTETGEIIGAAVIGPDAVDLIHEVVVAMHFRSTVADFVKIPHYHPTLSEIWEYPAEDLLFSD